jgi:hypothetical protein
MMINAQSEINISAKFRIAKYFTQIKSTTCQIKTRSYAWEQAPPRMSPYPVARSLES